MSERGAGPHASAVGRISRRFAELLERATLHGALPLPSATEVGLSEADVAKAAEPPSVAVDEAFEFCFPRYLNHPRAGSRLFVWAAYGPGVRDTNDGNVLRVPGGGPSCKRMHLCSESETRVMAEREEADFLQRVYHGAAAHLRETEPHPLLEEEVFYMSPEHIFTLLLGAKDFAEVQDRVMQERERLIRVFQCTNPRGKLLEDARLREAIMLQQATLAAALSSSSSSSTSSSTTKPRPKSPSAMSSTVRRQSESTTANIRERVDFTRQLSQTLVESGGVDGEWSEPRMNRALHRRASLISTPGGGATAVELTMNARIVRDYDDEGTVVERAAREAKKLALATVTAAAEGTSAPTAKAAATAAKGELQRRMRPPWRAPPRPRDVVSSPPRIRQAPS